MEENKNYNSIDMFKLLMAVAVVAIHTNPIVNWTNPAAIKIVTTIEGWAVPFFFTASGFFLFKTMGTTYTKSINRIDSYIIKIIKMYCAWTLFSLPLTLYGYIVSGNGIISCILSYFKYFLFVGKLYNSYHLWYLIALIYALIAIKLMIKRRFKLLTITGIAIVLYLFSEIMSVLVKNIDTLEGAVYQLIFLYQYVFNNGGIFTGMVFVSIGMLIACFQLRVPKWLGIAGILVLNILKLFMSNFGIRLVLPVEAALLFMVLLEMKISGNELWINCRKASTIIYLSHLLFFSLYTFIIIKEPNKLGFDSFIVTLAFSMLNALLLITAEKRGHLKLLKHII